MWFNFSFLTQIIRVMAYRIFVSYKNGAKSHSLNTTSRFLVEAQLASILAESEILSLAERIVIQFSGRDILNVPALTPASEVMESIKWPVCGCPARVEEPVTATLYMPKAVRDWLAMVGNGKGSAGLRKLIEMADIPELKNAWRQ